MKKTLHYCDTCGKEKSLSDLKYFVDIDICTLCQGFIIAKVLANKLLNLRPWCQTCHGTGKIEESDCEPYGRVTRTHHECKECKL